MRINFNTTNFNHNNFKAQKKPQKEYKTVNFESRKKILQTAVLTAEGLALAAILSSFPQKQNTNNKINNPKKQQDTIEISSKDTFVVKDINNDGNPEIIFIDKNKKKVAFDIQNKKIIEPKKQN